MARGSSRLLYLLANALLFAFSLGFLLPLLTLILVGLYYRGLTRA